MYDGSIRIDTRVNESGFNRSVSKMGASLKAIGRVMKTAFAVGIVGVAALVVGVIAAARFFTDLGRTIFDVMGKTVQYGNRVQELKKSFADLKNSFYSAFVGVFAIAIPYIQTAVMWLTKMMDTVTMVIAALLGQKTITKAITKGTEEQADATKKTAKEARGALAAFDEINVLEQKTDTGEAETGATATDEFATVTVPIDEKIQTFVNGIKEKLLEIGAPIWDGLVWIWENILVPLGNWVMNDALPVFLDIMATSFKILKEVWEDLKPVWDWFWNNVLKPLAEWTGGAIVQILNWILLGLQYILATIEEHGLWGGIVEILKDALKAYYYLFAILGAWIMLQWLKLKAWFMEKFIEPVKEYFNDLWETIKARLSAAWNYIVWVWLKAKAWFVANVTDPIKNAFNSVLEWLGDKWEDTFTGIKSFVKNTINTIIDFVNGMVKAVASGINGVIGGLNSIHVSIPDWIPGVGGQSWGLSIPRVSAPQIPRLATGAVIPPNAEFMAVLGDQKSGTNIETPEALLRQIVQEELGNIRADIEIKFGGSLGALVRDLKPYIDKENVRIGNSLVRSAV